jgi:hypothetical protein
MIDITPEESTSPVYLVPLTDEQKAEQAELHASQEAAILLAEETEKNRALARESALIKLKDFGLTEEEARAVIGL